LKLIQKAKREIRASVFGVALERESFIVSKGMVWGIFFSKGVVCLVRWGGIFFPFFSLFSKWDRRTIYGGGSENFLFPFPKGFFLGDMRKGRFDFF